MADPVEIERFAADITSVRELAPEVPLERDFEEWVRELGACAYAQQGIVFL